MLPVSQEEYVEGILKLYKKTFWFVKLEDLTSAKKTFEEFEEKLDKSDFINIPEHREKVCMFKDLSMELWESIEKLESKYK